MVNFEDVYKCRRLKIEQSSAPRIGLPIKSRPKRILSDEFAGACESAAFLPLCWHRIRSPWLATLPYRPAFGEVRMIASQECTLRRVRFRPVIRSLRPSLIDPAVQGDPWVTGCYLPNCLIVYFNNQPISLLSGSPLDQSTFNSMLFSMRIRYPRVMQRAVA
jgi:hypothetical protein